MSTYLETIGRNACLNGLIAGLDAAGADATADILFTNASDQQVALLTLPLPSFPAPANGSTTQNTITADTNATGGTMSRCRIRNRANQNVVGCNVGLSGSGAEVIATALNVPAGGTVAMAFFTLTMPAGTPVT